jgi:hypothetical protein
MALNDSQETRISGLTDDERSHVSEDQITEKHSRKLTSIWEDERIRKFVDDKDGKKKWQCLWCGGVFAQWNSCKAVAHVSGITGQDIRVCPSRIDAEHKAAYAALSSVKILKRTLKSMVDHQIHSTIEQQSQKSATALDYQRKKTRQSAGCVTASPWTDVSVGTNSLTSSGRTCNTIQLLLPTSGPTTPSADSQLTMAIADLIHSHGLPFSLASSLKFRKMLTLAKNVGMDYRPPGRNAIGSTLLDLNYDLYKRNHHVVLMQDAEVYGIAFYGDGATVKKVPLLNALASCVYNTAICLEIVDCSGHMEEGGKKDAKYIAGQFIPYIDACESEKKNVVDLVLFDGASNVQAAGQVLVACYPRITVLHGAEHVISLFFSDIFQIAEFSDFIVICRLLYKYFGSGSTHSTYAIFQKYAKQHNGGKKIGLTRASDTRMAGHLLCMMRLLRLQNALKSTVSSPEFIALKV